MQCLQLAEKYIPLIISWIEEGLKTHEICLPFCQEDNKRAVRPQKFNGFACLMCLQSVDYIAHLLETQTVESEIESLVEKFCANFDAPYNALCNTIVETSIPVIIRWIEDGLVPEDICVNIGLCSSENSTAVSRSKLHRKLPVVNFKKLPNGLGCYICTDVMTHIDAMIDDKRFDESMDVLLDQVCSLVNISIVSVLCPTFIDTIVEPYIADLIRNGINATQFCQNVGLCDATSSKVVPKPSRNNFNAPRHRLPIKYRRPIKDDGDVCTICTITINFIDQKMKNQEVQEEIIDGIFGFCDTLSLLYVPICKLIAQTYVPLIMSLITDGVETLDICNKLGFCTGYEVNLLKAHARKPLYLPPKSLPNIKQALKKIPSPSNDLCETCKDIIHEIELMLEDKKLQDEIIAGVKNFCDTLTQSELIACDQIAEKYVPLVINLIEDGFETLDVCGKIGFCQSTGHTSGRRPVVRQR